MEVAAIITGGLVLAVGFICGTILATDESRLEHARKLCEQDLEERRLDIKLLEAACKEEVRDE